MYQPVDAPDASIRLPSGDELVPLVTLADPSGARFHICMDDRCFVLYGKSHTTGEWRPVYHWFREAALALLAHLRGNI